MAEQIDILNDQLNKTKEKGLCSPKKDEVCMLLIGQVKNIYFTAS